MPMTAAGDSASRDKLEKADLSMTPAEMDWSMHHRDLLPGLRIEPGPVQARRSSPHPAGTLTSVGGFLGMKKILSHEFAAFAQPGALIAVLLVLLMMSAGDAAMAIAARGWPF